MNVQNESPVLPFAYGHRPADIALLAKHSFLAHIGPQDLGAFVELLDQVAVPAGTDVFRQGDESEHMYFVLEGEAHMRRGASEVARLGPGDPFGEVGMLGPRTRTETVQADTVLRSTSRASTRSTFRSSDRTSRASSPASASASRATTSPPEGASARGEGRSRSDPRTSSSSRDSTR